METVKQTKKYRSLSDMFAPAWCDIVSLTRYYGSNNLIERIAA